MPVIRDCKVCGRKNRVPVAHLADTGHCGACKAPLPPLDTPLEVDRSVFDEVVQNARIPRAGRFLGGLVGPCHMAAPEVEPAAADMVGRAIVLKIDTERYSDPAGRFNVRGIPYFIVFSGGRPVIQQAGVVNHRQLETWLRSVGSAPAA